jgi:hypothetical protein
MRVIVGASPGIRTLLSAYPASTNSHLALTDAPSRGTASGCPACLAAVGNLGLVKRSKRCCIGGAGR